MSDRALGGFGLALALFYIWAATIIPDSFMADAVGPRMFPYIVGTIIILCSIYFIAKPDAEPVWPPAGTLLELLFAVAVMALYAQFLPELGFAICTAIATTYLTWRLGSPPLGSVVTGILTSAGIYIVFRLILGLSLAKGPLGF